MSGFPLTTTDLATAGMREEPIERLCRLIEGHIAEGKYPGAQIAIARNGQLALSRNFGLAAPGRPVDDDTLWLLFSNTKVITAAATWVLAEQGAFRFTDKVADHIPDFARNGKEDITIMQVITHQGGFPNARMPQAGWEDRGKRREAVCNFTLEHSPGSRLHYHGQSAHWVLAVLMETLTGRDFRDVIRDLVIRPLGLDRDMFVGIDPRTKSKSSVEGGDKLKKGVLDLFAINRTIEMVAPQPDGSNAPVPENNTPAWKKAGSPGAGGYATARGMAALYQMMLNGGELGGTRILSPRTLGYAIRNWTGDMVDHYMGMPMHRGLGPHLRGTTPSIRGLGSFASPRTYGHGGAGISYCWADPDSGVSFAYLTNCRIPDPWHSRRLDLVSNFVHAAIL